MINPEGVPRWAAYRNGGRTPQGEHRKARAAIRPASTRYKPGGNATDAKPSAGERAASGEAYSLNLRRELTASRCRQGPPSTSVAVPKCCNDRPSISPSADTRLGPIAFRPDNGGRC